MGNDIERLREAVADWRVLAEQYAAQRDDAYRNYDEAKHYADTVISERDDLRVMLGEARVEIERLRKEVNSLKE